MCVRRVHVAETAVDYMRCSSTQRRRHMTYNTTDIVVLKGETVRTGSQGGRVIRDEDQLAGQSGHASDEANWYSPVLL